MTKPAEAEESETRMTRFGDGISVNWCWEFAVTPGAARELPVIGWCG
jgi:hypothetical protein